MAQNVTVTLDQSFRELQVPGYSKSRSAANIAPAVLGSNYALGGLIARKSALPLDFWQEPNTGIIMQRPSTMRADFWENNIFYSKLVVANQFLFNDNPAGSGVSFITPGSMLAASGKNLPPQALAVVRRANAGAAALAIAVENYIALLLSNIDNSLTPILQFSTPLDPNEGFSWWVYPPGVFTDRAINYAICNFGRKYALHICLDGTARLWLDVDFVNGLTTSNWQMVSIMKYAASGVDHTKPFQVTVIPFGTEYIAFAFSQDASPNKQGIGKVGIDQGNTFLYKCSKYEPWPRFDNATQQYIKTETCTVTISVRTYYYHYTMAFASVIYAPSATLQCWPEPLPQPNTNTPQISTYGFQPGGATLVSSYTNKKGTSYTPGTDNEVMVNFQFTSSANQKYTSELWQYDVNIAEVVGYPNWTPTDISNLWSYIRFQRTTDLDTAKAEIKLVDSASRFPIFMKAAGHPIRITVNGTNGGGPIFDGYVDRDLPTLETKATGGFTSPSAQARITDQKSAFDMWTRLNEKYVDDYQFLDGLQMTAVLTQLIQKAGFLPADIFIDDPTGYIGSFYFESFQTPQDFKQISPDASVGDVIRLLLKNYWANPIRVRWTGSQWHIYVAPTYSYVAGTPPTMQFIMQSQLSKSQTTRWQNQIYAVKGKPEWTLEQIEFNGLIARTVKEMGEGSDGFQAIIPNNVTPSNINDGYDYFAYRSANDPTYPWFVGRPKIKVIQPPEIMLATSQAELEKLAYIYYQRYAKNRPKVEFLGEWIPGIDVDQFFWLTGVDANGNQVSYGAYRIDHMDVEIRHDWPNLTADPRYANLPNLQNVDMSFTNQCRYTATLVGLATSNTIPMYTATSNIPL